MNSTAWLHHFESNRNNRPEPQWELPCGEDPVTAAKLAGSLSHLQLGEDVEGSFLITVAQRTHPDDPDYVEALRLFVAEEREHARLLERLVARFGGTLLSRHWTHAAFGVLRRMLGVQFETQTLLIAELIGTAYYRLLHRHAGDRVLVQVCELVIADETAHIEFHSDRLAAWQWHWLPLAGGLWAAQFQLFFLAAAHAIWFDHRKALMALGSTRREFLREACRECQGFLARSKPAGGPGRLASENSPLGDRGYERC